MSRATTNRDSVAFACTVANAMRIFQALRRSIKGDKDKSPQIAIAPKSAVAIVPPKKVIRALYDYEAQSTQELGFSRGDFFHVIGRENDSDWYEACNPALPDARGLVPVAFFQALGRTERDSGQSDSGPRSATKKEDHDSGFSETNPSAMPPPTPALSQSSAKTAVKNGAMVYGIVMYDFQAERADELEAKAGEAIIVIAQSNPEWFVAKPIGRLGGPGLIPVSFVEIRDMGTDTAVPNPQDAVKRAGVPRVEEWKKMAAEYKNSSITLGKFEVGGAPGQAQSVEQGFERKSLQSGANRQSEQLTPSNQQQQTQQGGYQQQAQQGQQSQRNTQQSQTAQKPASMMYAPISAQIPRYCFAEEKYWFVIEASLEDGRHWELSRYYEDFYDFQIALLTEFPAEAGNTGTQKRTLPYMPGPVNYVTDAITEGRLHNLDAYVKNLLGQPAYIAKCNLVKQFFAPREGDYEVDPNSNGDEYRLSAGSRSSTDSPRDGASRQSSKNNLNGNGYSGLSAAPRQMQNGQPQMTRQTSSLSQPSLTSLSPGLNQAASTSAFKVKLFFNGDTFLIRVPSDTNFQQLYEKIRERTKIAGGEQIQLFYRDEQSGDKLSLMSNNDLNYALDHNEKLVIFVEQV
ncbi:Uu.00g054410.m01.CDS01 [Anthostomella pinea]|uniref:Uu.00g054410.m01.CDS01 n=1 Tax=Anthostomella pinea TaxID=933095 RepID=A0AAI8YPR4_9PEZI|nr:Uu.00g054410.m01.CDS01 [Anthostomella pinea]